MGRRKPPNHPHTDGTLRTLPSCARTNHAFRRSIGLVGSNSWTFFPSGFNPRFWHSLAGHGRRRNCRCFSYRTTTGAQGQGKFLVAANAPRGAGIVAAIVCRNVYWFNFCFCSRADESGGFDFHLAFVLRLRVALGWIFYVARHEVVWLCFHRNFLCNTLYFSVYSSAEH